MKLASILFASLAAVVLLHTSCSDDPDISVTRDTDQLNFAYGISTQSFTVRTNGSWSLSTDNDWIHMTPSQGVGDGRSYQYIDVTVDRNAGEKRTGEIVIHAAGREVKVFVNQDDGIFALKQAYILGTLLEGEEISGIYVAIPYEKALGTELMDVDVELDGEGSPGIKCESVRGEKLQEGDGEVLVALSGTPRSMGDIDIEVTIGLSSQESPVVQTTRSFVSSENIIYEMTFDKLIWGGDYVANKTGMWPGNQNLDVTPDTPANVVATSGQDGSGDFFNAGMNPAFTADRGLSEWDGSKVYEHPGYPKIGTGSALGWIMSPALNFQALGLSEPQNIFVQFDYCRWDGEQDDIVVTAENAGSMPDTRLVKDHPKRTWQSIVFKVTGATSATRIKISGTKAGNNRFFIDNYRVYVSQAKPVEVVSKLETPTALNCTEQTPSSLSFSWKRDYDASSYTVELYKADNETSAVKSEVVMDSECTFDALDPSTDYKFRVMSNCQSKPEFNSDYSAFLPCRTLDPVAIPAPQVSLYLASRGLLVFEWPRDDAYPRKFILELAESASGEAVRTVECKEPVKGKGFYANYPYNRFVFGNLQADKTYYCRVKILGEGVYTDSEFGVGEGRTLPMPVLGEEVLLYKDFDDFWWGGYSIAAAFGICPSSAAQKLPETLNITGSVYADDGTTVVAEPSKNADDTFATIGKNNADYLTARWGEADWDTANSKKIYEVCGHLKFGTGSAAGSLVLPHLTKLGDATADIELTFRACPYTEPKKIQDDPVVYTLYGNQDRKDFTVSVSGGGTFEDGSTKITLYNDDSGRDNNGRFAWTDHSVVIRNVTAETRITIATIEKRMWLDDIKVVKK
ncbi:fibronectin type III domain-containing protein [Alistipes sp.]|uniref:fibronectin type III domain-containing protein n=1 Tax=Alistipes sp. TaxID=1872444 RepID=UPI003A8642A5